uniref:DUF3991 domain-containing protein n=1 Tax=Acidicaldus sp. TaxID=1872105 RepID=A0A8J4HA56_9PROT
MVIRLRVRRVTSAVSMPPAKPLCFPTLSMIATAGSVTAGAVRAAMAASGIARLALSPRRRGLPACVLRNARDQDTVREGPKGSAWFAHRREGGVCHVEIRGPACKSALADGRKRLFRFMGVAKAAMHRLAVAEAPIDALRACKSIELEKECPLETLAFFRQFTRKRAFFFKLSASRS